MPKAFRVVMVATALALGLGGCVGTAGVSTWEYRSAPGSETERVHESRLQVDAGQGVTREACTRLSRRQVDRSGAISGEDMTDCR